MEDTVRRNLRRAKKYIILSAVMTGVNVIMVAINLLMR